MQPALSGGAEQPHRLRPALSLDRITKSFGERKVLDEAGFTVRWGEVHALLGENGAGKSTIMNVATGVYAADEGEVAVDEQEVAIRGPADAARAGIGMVHQHFRLVNCFSVAENILLAAGKLVPGVTNLRSAARAVEAKGREVGLTVRANARIDDLSVAERQRVEILKVLILGARIVILDEPTAVLTDDEARSLLVFVRRLAQAGCAVVLITHKLREVLDHSDRVTVMRQGKTVLADAQTAGLDASELARQMVGDRVARITPVNVAPGADRLTLRNLTVPRRDGTVGIEDVSLTLRAGEILGIAGVGGNGQQQLADGLIGLDPAAAGQVLIGTDDITHLSVAQRRARGLRIIPSDRFASGLVGDLTVAENLGLTMLRQGSLNRGLLIDRAALRQRAEAAITAYSIAGAAPNRTSRLLSGGNAQKLILAREIDPDLTVLVAHSPTRGLDVKACLFVHEAIKACVEAGAACLLISEDLEEVLSLSTRVAVMCAGRIAGEMPIEQATSERIGRLMMGHV
jgi:simple sugar transport system ATP-binding protein